MGGRVWGGVRVVLVVQGHNPFAFQLMCLFLCMDGFGWMGGGGRGRACVFVLVCVCKV